MALASISATFAGSVPNYAVVDLGTLGGSAGSQATAINNSGNVVGGSYTSGNVAYHAFLYSNGSMHDIGTVANGSYTYATGINDNNQIVGCDDMNNHVFLYSNASMLDLDVWDGSFSGATGINNTGQICGWAYISSINDEDAILYKNGTLQDLGNLGEGGTANAINAGGHIVGSSHLDPSTNIVGAIRHPFLYENDTMTDIETWSGQFGEAFAINNNDQVVGTSTSNVTNGNFHAFLYSGGSMQDLGVGTAYGINDNGIIVGQNGNGHAFVYANGTMTDLNTLTVPIISGWTLQEATAINDTGQIVGVGVNPAGQPHAFLLNPVPAGGSSVD